MMTLLEKCEVKKTDFDEAILEQRNTPIQDICLSPAEVMFNRKVRCMIPQYNRSSRNQKLLQSPEGETNAYSK